MSRFRRARTWTTSRGSCSRTTRSTARSSRAARSLAIAARRAVRDRGLRGAERGFRQRGERRGGRAAPGRSPAQLTGRRCPRGARARGLRRAPAARTRTTKALGAASRSRSSVSPRCVGVRRPARGVDGFAARAARGAARRCASPRPFQVRGRCGAFRDVGGARPGRRGLGGRDRVRRDGAGSARSSGRRRAAARHPARAARTAGYRMKLAAAALRECTRTRSRTG